MLSAELSCFVSSRTPPPVPPKYSGSILLFESVRSLSALALVKSLYPLTFDPHPAVTLGVGCIRPIYAAAATLLLGPIYAAAATLLLAATYALFTFL